MLAGTLSIPRQVRDTDTGTILFYIGHGQYRNRRTGKIVRSSDLYSHAGPMYARFEVITN